MKQYDYTLVGGAAMVQMLRFQKLPEVGETSMPINRNPAELYFGGCGFNIYSGLAKLGVPVMPVLTHAHPMLAERLHQDSLRYGFPEDGIFGPLAERYFQCLMMGDEKGDNLTIAYWFGKDVDGNGFQRRPVTFQDSFFTNSNAVILVMSTPDTGWQTVEMARKHEKPLIYSYRNDPAQISHDMLREILGETAVLFTNEAEARAIEKQFSLDHITDLFRTAKAQVIVTTLGKRGCLIYDKNSGRDYEQTLVPITSGGNGFVDAVGAGDGFVAGFLYGMSRKKPLPVCAQYGSTLASFVIECDGSTTNLPDEEALLARNQTRPDAM